MTLSGFGVRRLENFHFPTLLFPMVLWLIAILFSLKNAVHKSLVFEFFFWQLLLIFLYHLSCKIGEEQKKLIFNSIALASGLAGIYGALQHFGIDFVSWGTSWGDRPSSTFGNPNFAAGWWVMTCPIFFAKFIIEKNKIRWFWLALALLMLVNLYWGKTRGAWIAFIFSSFVGLSFFFLIKKKEKIKFYAGVLISLFFLFLFFIGLILPQFLDISIPSVIERYFKWATAWQMVKDYPLFGVGAGNLKVNFALYQAEVREQKPFKEHLSFRATSESNVHNEYFQIWAETGTVGLVAFLGIFLCYFYKFFKTFREQEEKNHLFQIGIAVCILAFLLYSLTNFPLHIVPNACLLFFLLGINETFSLKEKKQSSLFSPLPKGRVRGILNMISLGLLLVISIKWLIPPLQADYFRLQAEIADAEQNFFKAAELYHRAIRLDFYHSERTAYNLGEVYRKSGKIQEALQSYQISVALRNYGEIYNNIGNCYYLLGRKKEAIQNWKIAIRLGLPDPNAQKQTEKNIYLLE